MSPDTDILRDMITIAAERLMEVEVVNMTGAPYGEKSPGRLVSREASPGIRAESDRPAWENDFLHFERRQHQLRLVLPAGPD